MSSRSKLLPPARTTPSRANRSVCGRNRRVRSETGPVLGGTRIRADPRRPVDYEIQARKLAADARLRAATGTRPGPESMTKEQIATTVTAISDLMQAFRYATTEDKAEIYPGLKNGTRRSISAVMAPILLRHSCCAADPDQVDLCASAGCQMSGSNRSRALQGTYGFCSPVARRWSARRGRRGLRVIREYVCSWPGLVRV
jgi:hypothetical protein